MSTTRSTPEDDPATADLLVRNLDVTRPHGVHVRIEDPAEDHAAYANDFLLGDGEQAYVDEAVPAAPWDVVVTVDGGLTTAHTDRLEDGATLVVAVGNGLVHVGENL